MTFSQGIIIFSHIPILVTAVYAGVNYRSLGRELKIFTGFIFLSWIIQFTSLVFWFSRENNLPLLHVYTAVGFVLLAWFYRAVLQDFMDRRVIEAVAVLFFLFTVVNTWFFQPIFTFNSYALTAESVLVIILSLSTYMLLLNDIVKEKRKQDIPSLHWINSGLFIYYSSSLLIFYFGALITHAFPKDLSRYTWVLHSFFSIVMYTCFFVGLWKRPKR